MADFYRNLPVYGGGNTIWTGQDPASVLLRNEFFGIPPAPPPSGSNPSTIMGAGEVLWYADAAASPLWQNTDGTGAVTDGSVVRRIDGLVGPNALAGATDREAIYRENGGDPYLEGDASSQLRGTLSRGAGDFYAILRIQYRGTGTQQDQPFTVATNTSTFYTGTDWCAVRLSPFFTPVRARFEVGSGTEPGMLDAPRDAWQTIEIYGNSTVNAIAVNGGSFATASRSVAFPATGYFDIFNSTDGGSISPGVATWFRRGAILNAIPNAAQRAELLEWATNGDTGGGGTSAGTSTASAVGASNRAASGTTSGTSTVAAAGQALIGTVGSSAGIATALAVGDTAGIINSGAGSSAGLATVAATGASTRASSGATAGVATVSAVGASTRASSGTSSGVTTIQATGQATSQAVASTTGSGAASATGAAIAASTASSSGIATVNSVSPGGSISSGAGSSSGTSTVSGVGASIRSGAASSAGTSTVNATGQRVIQSVASTAGTSAVNAVGRSFASSLGNTTGTSTVNGVANPIVAFLGSALGTSSAQAVGAVITNGTKLKRWNGSAWVEHDLKYYNGTEWVAARLKRFNSGTWE